LLGCVTAAAIGRDAAAIDLDRLVMPGPVIAAHARWETQCNECHRPLDRGGQDALCLDCHEEQREDQRTRTGFHGRSAAVLSAAACRACHSEHLGRDADVVGLFAETFDHRETDFPLEGGHASVACGSCHPAEASHREAPDACVECHREDDPHGEAMDDDCAECHSAASWKEARFDHDKTDFPLRGAHGSVACLLCHPAPTAPSPPTDCVGCHRLDDVHRKTLGTDCASCHGVERWSQASFDHGKDTDFALRGAHERLECLACHTAPPESGETSSDCISCHRSRDVHAGRNGSACGTCHGAESWSELLFDHGLDTGFGLEGAHAGLRCAQCHGTRLDGLPESPTCAECHRGDDVHGGSLSPRCDTCHGSQAWSHPIVFEHDVARFPLLGMHATAACEQCHVSRKFDRIERSCHSCHEPDDTHEGAFGADCGRCHGPNGWTLWEFDHARETSFVLHGAHEDLTCSACHRADAPRSRATSSRCVFCHADDDAHFGAFGERCEACHTDQDWEYVRPRR
jgi:hypothetical protein